ncbi:class I SAM-dependent methyltransferase [Mesoterricola sediminis]|uniref:D-mycarose 3-C-methyltransferase n=1 Tax=Mesoterricola sediminis TaxID=2927980 RepID=A0AA48GW85_9BACT|nr:class I SAM-dependent methyltransferase [Mesoterricola sediminis]BDU75227.1 D-mycarose 3-C-methyltransferase [Mesoterricola sediminis]
MTHLPPALPRPCPGCACPDHRVLHAQRLAVPAEGALLAGYDVVACEACGLVFASPLPDQAAFDAYYRDQSQYEGHDRVSSSLSAYDLRHYGAVAEHLARLVPDRATRILDMGCARGGQLEALAAVGFRNLAGVDPSPACIAQGGARVRASFRQGWVGDLRPGECDVLILGSVLEHLRDLAPLLDHLRACLAPGAGCYVEVPDAGRFAEGLDAPFQEFSAEHINFFTAASLQGLMARHGFALVECWPARILQAPGKWVLDLKAFYRVDPAVSPLRGRDEEGERAIAAYVAASRALEARDRPRLAEMARQGGPLIVWGVGVHTRRLLAEGVLDPAHIAAFVDSNPKNQGLTFQDRPVLAPEQLTGRTERILISSMQFERDIFRQIRQTLGLANSVSTLYTPVDALERDLAEDP